MKNTCFLSGALALICSYVTLTAQESDRAPKDRPDRDVPQEKARDGERREQAERRDGDRERNPEREGDRRLALVEEAAQKLRAAGMPDEAERLMARARAERQAPREREVTREAPPRDAAPGVRPNAEMAQHVERLSHMVRELQEAVANLRREVAELKGNRAHGESREQEEGHAEEVSEKGEH